jgi:hypothetical protein
MWLSNFIAAKHCSFLDRQPPWIYSEDARTKGYDSPLVLKPFHASELLAEMGRMITSQPMRVLA